MTQRHHRPAKSHENVDTTAEVGLAAEADAATVLQEQITDLAVEFRLVSQFTAFVAVDESRVVGNGQPLRVMQPVEVPAGTSYEGGTVELPRP